MTRRDAPFEEIHVDGAGGDTCAPVVRAALSLSIVTQQPFRMFWREQDALNAEGAAALKGALLLGGSAGGGEEGSRELHFSPSPLKASSFRSDFVGPGLLKTMEMLAVPLAYAKAPSEIRLNGITHPVRDVSFHESALGWAPLLERIGIAGEWRLDAAGFSAEAPGAVSARIFPTPKLRSLDLTQRGMLLEVQSLVLVANLGIGIALPIERRLSERLRARGILAQVEMLPLPVERGRGLCAGLVVQFEHSRVAWAVAGEPGQSADAIAEAVVDRFQQFLRHGGAVPGDVAARLIVPLALAASSFGAPGAIGRESRGTSRLSMTEVTGELLAVVGVARQFLDVEVQVQGLPGDEGSVEIRPRVSSES